MEDRIEQRITIRATHDKVWQLVTRPGWWLPGSKAEPARGPGRVTVGCGDDRRPYLVDVYVRPIGDEIGVTVVESGFTALDLPEPLREDERKGNTGGWQYEMAGLRTRAEQGG